MSAKWTQRDIPNLSGKVIVVTGANSGLGFECSKTFAQKRSYGCHDRSKYG